jgi:hypothetical protein
MDDVSDDKNISMCRFYARHVYIEKERKREREREQINGQINEGEEKAVKKRKRRIFHANQINDNLCMYIYMCVCACVYHFTYLYISKANSLIFLRYTQLISHFLRTIFIFVDAFFLYLSFNILYFVFIFMELYGRR